MPEKLYPLLFEPIFKTKVWGGRRLAGVLNKKLPGEDPVGESWEVVDTGGESGVITNGPLSGKTLHEIFISYEEALVGTASVGRTFPLLLKFIDAGDVLSVQVHPDSECAERINDPGARRKTEAWYVLDSEPDSRMYLGVKEGTTRESFEKLLREGRLEDCLNSFPVGRCDVLFVPAGTIHAIGKGILLYEIQECSDTTYRVYDWNRLGLDGKPRKLHLSEALEAAYFEPPKSNTIKSVPIETDFGTVTRHIHCDSFVLTEYNLENHAEITTDGKTFHIVTAVDGSADIDSEDGGVELPLGRTTLVPAAISRYRITPGQTCRVLVSSLPR
ncbi:MAG: mannose-6-phosphate isomerase [Planctomycetota bacterium]|nr:MAG: mannose-6-phosphate isomerase [Planctomycetota bacterium]